MIATEYLDLIAICLFLGGWIVLVAKDISQRKSTTDPLAAFFFMLGSIVLAAVQFSKSKTLFIALGLTIAILSILNWFYIPQRVKQVKNEIKRAEKKVLRKKK